MDKYIGKKLDGRFEIQKLIGSGGMANVYKAKDRLDENESIVAVKILKKEYAENEEFLRRFRNESLAIAQLFHPNIVKIIDVGFRNNSDTQYIAMEYIEGITLKNYMEKDKGMEWQTAVHFMLQILRAIGHAHSKGIFHRDIKPQNIMVLKDTKADTASILGVKIHDKDEIVLIAKGIVRAGFDLSKLSEEDISAKADDEHATIFVVHRHELGKESYTCCL